MPKLTVKRKMLPLPSWLWTEMLPPINSQSCLLMASPSPVPPYMRVNDVSGWLKGLEENRNLFCAHADSVITH